MSATPLCTIAADGDNARAVFAMICTREGLSLGHRDEALRRYIDGCVTAKMKVYDHDMADPATAHIQKSSAALGAARTPGCEVRPGQLRNAYGCFGVLYSTSFWNGFQTVS